MERVRRRGEEEREKALSAGGAHPLDPTRPWDWVWGEVLSDADFWRAELEEPALLAITRGARSAPSSENIAPAQPGKRIADVSGVVPQKRQRQDQPGDGQPHVRNRKGKLLCADFNAGRCTSGGPGSVNCPVHSGQVHQCSICLSPSHGASGHTAAEAGGKDKGKGRGKGKRRRGGY